MTSTQKINFKRACLFPFLVYVVYFFLLEYTISILILIGIYYLVRFKNRKKIKRRLRNIMDDAVKKISLKYDYSYLVIAKPTMLHNDFKIIKNTLFQDFERIK